MTAHGIVVEIEDHQTSDGTNSGGSHGVIFTGELLSKELKWYSALAAAYADNPCVWFGTNNEPAGNGAPLSEWQRQAYLVIRRTRNNNPIMIQGRAPTTWCSRST